jgi:hypothetical protein
MGLLDDAIREHLDLKRRRGADPSEVARLEQEALGPVRRERAPAEAADEHHDETHAQEPAAAEPAAPPHAEPPPAGDEGLQQDDRTRVLAPEDRREPPHGDALLDEQHAPDAELGGAAATAPEPVAEPERVEPEPARELQPEPEPRASTEDPRHSDIVDQPTTEYRVEDHHDEDEHEASAAHGGPEEDVLEETPDFLQETPEHDRLWFEQRPPRDFDFDG